MFLEVALAALAAKLFLETVPVVFAVLDCILLEAFGVIDFFDIIERLNKEHLLAALTPIQAQFKSYKNLVCQILIDNCKNIIIYNYTHYHNPITYNNLSPVENYDRFNTLLILYLLISLYL